MTVVSKPSPVGSTHILDPQRQLLIICVLGFRDTIHFPLSLAVQIQPHTSGPGSQSKIFLLTSIPTLSTLICACDPMDCSPPGSSVQPMGFSRQEHWSGLPCLPPGDLPNLGIKPISYVSCTAGGFFTAEPPGKAPHWSNWSLIELFSLLFCRFPRSSLWTPKR